MAMPVTHHSNVRNPMHGKIVPIFPPQDEAPAHSSCVTLYIDQIQPYAGNPRVAGNPMKEEIKASIIARGLDAPLCVTRRPGQSAYTLQSGGNTRLEILRELYHETGEVRFRSVPVMVHPWVNETHVMAGHLAENVLRGDMCFADISAAVMELKHSIEEEGGDSLTWKEFEGRLSQLGFNISHTQLARMRYMDKHIKEAVPDADRICLGSYHVQKLMCATKGSDWLSEERKTDLQDILTRHGSDIDAAINEITCGQLSDNRIHEPATDTCEDNQNTEGPACDKSLSPIHLLQHILDLRKRNCRMVMESSAFAHFADVDDGFGFTKRKDKDIPKESFSHILACITDMLPSTSFSKAWTSLDDYTANIGIKILKNIRAIAMDAGNLDDAGIKHAIDRSNEDLMRLRDELDPNSASESRLLKDYIIHAATTPMILSLFKGITIVHIKDLREDLGVEPPCGRPSKAWPYEAEKICHAWSKYSGEDKRHRYLSTSIETAAPLGTIWNTIQSRLYPADREGSDE